MDGFDWAEDLKKLLGEAAEGIYSSENTPFNEIANRDIAGVIGSPITAFGNAASLGSDLLKSQVGGLYAAPATIRNAVGLGDAGTRHTAELLAGDEGRPDMMSDPNAGGRRVWEEGVKGIAESDRLGLLKTPILAALELGVDPGTWIGAGIASKAVQGAEKAARIGVAGAEDLQTMRGANQALNYLYNEAPIVAARKIGKPVVGAAGRVINRVAPNALQLDKRSQLGREMNDLGMAFREKLDSQQRMPGQFLPALVGQRNRGKYLAPIDHYDVPPFFADQFDSGVSRVIKQRAWESYQKLKMSQPDIPGINAPGFSAIDRPWMAGMREGFQSPGMNQFPAASGPGRMGPAQDVGRLRGFADRLRNNKVGFINQPPGGYKTPMDVRIDEENLQDMAEIGLAAVLDYDNQNANKLFGSLLRVSEGNNAARKAIIGKYGAGVEPVLPLVHEQMQNLAPEGMELGSSRFITPWGFTEGLDKVETATLKRVQDQISSGKMTEQEALAYLSQRGMSKASPQVTEHAANMGAGFLASIRNMENNPADFGQAFHGFSGSMRPSQIDPSTGRALVPEEFNNYVNRTIDDNRQAYSTYMRQTFGNLTEPELETLRKMSVESLYDAMIEAASPVGFGDQGATTVLKKGADVDEFGNPITRTVTKTSRTTGQTYDVEKNIYSGEHQTKIGVLPAGPGSYAARTGEITPDFPAANTLFHRKARYNEREFQRLYPDQQPTAALYKQVTGNLGGSVPKAKKIEDLIRAKGGTVWEDNALEGILPNTQRLIDYFNSGKNIKVGEGVAEDWYEDAVEEVMQIVGPGRYEDAHALIEFIAITSSGTDVTLNGRNALRAYAEWKLGTDDFLRNKMGLSKEEIDRLLDNRLQDSEDPLNLFRRQMSRSQKQKIGEAMTELARRLDPPSLMYHGSPQAGLTVLDSSQGRRQFASATGEWGTHFTPDQEKAAASYAYRGPGKEGSVYGAEVNLNNPYEMPHQEFASYDKRSPDMDTVYRAEKKLQQIKAAGHDGIRVLKKDGSVDEVISFDPVTPWSGTPFAPLQGGPKTNNFAGSFILKLWNKSMDHALQDNPQLRDRVKEALDKAATIYTVDRHDSRIFGGATSVTKRASIMEREQGILAAKVADVRPEDFQAGMWYWSKQQQGFVPQRRTDDLAGALRTAWNEKKDPSRIAPIREKIKRDNPGISEPDLELAADDMMRQEVVLSVIEETFKGRAKDIEKRIGKNPLTFMQRSGEDYLGIINRGESGDGGAVRPSTHIPALTTRAEQELESINKGTSEGATFAWDQASQRFTPANDAGGYAVALTSAGRDVSTKTRKTASKAINQFLIKHGDLLDEPGVADHVRFGLFPMGPGKASFDLTVIVPDEQAAIDLARKANQRSIWDIANGKVIETGGDGTPVIEKTDEIRDILHGLFGKQIRERQSIQEVRNRGVTLDELDSVNPVSILQRKVVQPLMQRFREASLKDLADKQQPPDPRTVLAGGQGEFGPVGVDAATPFDFEAIGQDPLISTQANQILGRTFDNGESYGTRLTGYQTEATDDARVLHDSGISWGPDATVEERLAAAKDNGSVQDIIKKYDKLRVDPMFSTPDQITMARMRRDLGGKYDIDFDHQSKWDLIKAAWGEQALFSPKYHTGNIQGAWLANAFGGTFRAGTPKEFITAYKLASGGLYGPERKEALRQLHAFQIAEKWGFEDLPAYLQKGGVRSMAGSREYSRSAMGELVGRTTGNQKLGRAVGKPFAANNNFGDGVELVMRGSLWSDTLDREMVSRMTEVEDSIRRMAEKQGLDQFEFSAINGINQLPGGTGTGKLKDFLIQSGFSDGYAERAARNFSEARNAAERVAKSEVDKRQFTYERTNLDNFVSNFVPFHYYISRAIRYYGEEALRHPYLVLDYMRANDFIDDAQTDPGLDARQKGFLRLMGTPLGFTLLMNPDALFGVVKVFNMDDDYSPDGQPKMGQVINWLKNRGMGLYPWLDGTMNLMGVYGDTFEPDVLGIRHKAIIGAAVNFMRASLGMDPAQAPYQQAMGQARYNISSFVSQFTPDWLTQPVLPKAGGSTGDATMDQLIESRVIANHPGLSNGGLLDIMSDSESPEYTEAYRQVATSGLAQQLLNFSLPQSFRLRESTRDVRSAQVRTISEAAAIQGVNPYEFKPSVGDINFATQYKDLTGNTWQPGDYKGAKFKQDLTQATPEEKPYIMQEAEYRNLGGPAGTKVFKKYNALKFGTDPQTAGLDPDTQRIIADQWADQYGHRRLINDVYDQRNAYEMTHPEFQQFKGWQDQMYQLRDHLGGDLGEYRRQAAQQNPNAAAYFQRTEQWIKETMPEDEWVEQMDESTSNMSAFLAVNGIPQDRFNPAPQPGVPPVDVTLPTMVNSMMSQQGGQYNWENGLNQYAQYMYGLNPQQHWG